MRIGKAALDRIYRDGLQRKVENIYYLTIIFFLDVGWFLRVFCFDIASSFRL